MIDAFVESWPLFADTYLAGWLIAALLGVVGVVVVARNQMFIGAAVAQASTFGVAVALVLSASIASTLAADHEAHGLHAAEAGDTAETLEHILPTAFAMVFAVGAALLMNRQPKPGSASPEAITGWVFLLASAGAILTVAHSPHGMEEVKGLLASTLINPPREDVWLLAGALIITVAALLRWHRTIRLLVMDSDTSAALGVNVQRWNMLLAIWLGLVLGLALHVAGLLYVFGCLILPGLLARNVCRRMGSMFLVAPLLAVGITMVAFVLAYHYDLPIAHTAIALLAAMQPVTWMLGRKSI